MMRGRAIHWWLQRVTGAALLVLLVLHFWTNHYASNVRRGELSFEVVQQRMSNPWMVAIEISFLLIALYHGLNGLRGIILDYGWVTPRIAKSVTSLLVILGLVWAYWGVTAFVGNRHLQPGAPNPLKNAVQTPEAHVASAR
ncbi:MAG: succinate dehydrogenase / fumarate reductase, rane anchor subunit [Phycisphaerales bacterium]|jgi:succinate dehydrogenase / fumarate reductase membrane anchor subunit|nr:succinate dehydrogenase / fumarate reductase, rane anchor subunit [Phycisphaerales bacterium]